MSELSFTGNGGRILDIDCECLPGHWIGGDYVSKIITAVAWKWIGEKGDVSVLTHYEYTADDMAGALAAAVELADIVTGHYIRGFDLRLLNGNLLRSGQSPLSPVLAHDTKLDLLKTHGRSLSQRNLAAQIGVSKPKIDVTLPDWESFNLRLPGYAERGVERVVGDVLQNIEMRQKLMDLGWIGPPMMWRSESAGHGKYHA